MAESAYLTFRSDDGPSGKITLGAGVFRIGRLEENDLVLDNPYISRFHAQIVADNSTYLLDDLDSTSGSFVNDERIERRPLREGDQIRFGQEHGIDLVFHTQQGEDQSASDGAQLAFKPIRLIDPDEARFIHIEKLPPTRDLASETVDRLRALYEFSTELHRVTSNSELAEALARFLHRTLNAERTAVLFCDRDQDSVRVAAVYPPGSERDVAPSLGIAGRIIKENVAMLSLDASRDERFSSHQSVQLQSIRAVMCAPMGSMTRVWGVCYADNLSTDRAFAEEELDFMAAVARQAGLRMENLFLLDEQRRSLESFIRTLSASIGARDDTTAGHSGRVGAYSSGIAKTMELDPAESRLIYYAGLLHDYGKIGTRDDVLLKPAELTAEEYEHIKEHPLHTFRILSKIRFPEDLADIPRVAAAHHERWDGNGYPHGLRGEEIPLGSRIVAVADAYDALAEERVYHEPLPPEEAFAAISARSGTYFDPAVIEAFAKYFEREIKPRPRRARRAYAKTMQGRTSDADDAAEPASP
jgi:HD-GYP domain-containing protein (c-di-GMP phosphodiesterase class II)